MALPWVPAATWPLRSLPEHYGWSIDSDESHLIGKAVGGDRGALDTLLRTHYEKIYAVCYRLMGNPADAADAAQNALISITKNLARFDGRSAFGTWAYRIATNASLDELRRRSRRAEPGLDDLETSERVSVGAGRVDDIEQFDTSDEVQLALNQLTNDFRAPVVLRDLLGYDYAEIGKILDLPAGTVRSRIARGRSTLRDLLGNQDASADVKVDDHE